MRAEAFSISLFAVPKTKGLPPPLPLATVGGDPEAEFGVDWPLPLLPVAVAVVGDPALVL